MKDFKEILKKWQKSLDKSKQIWYFIFSFYKTKLFDVREHLPNSKDN